MYKNSEKEQVKGYQAKPMDVVREYYDNPLWYDQCEIDQEMIDMGMAKNFTLIRKAPTSEYPEGEWIDGYGPNVGPIDEEIEQASKRYKKALRFFDPVKDEIKAAFIEGTKWARDYKAPMTSNSHAARNDTQTNLTLTEGRQND